MTIFYDTERLFAFTISVIVGVSGKLAYDSLKHKITFTNIIQAFGLGFFIGFVLDNLLAIIGKEGWRFVIVPFGVYSATYLLQLWHTDNKGILIQILNFFLGRLTKTEQENKDKDEPDTNE